MRERRLVVSAILAVMMAVTAAMPAFAAERTVSSVSLRVHSELEAGSTLPDPSYSNNGDASVSDGDICISNSSSRYTITDVSWVTSTSRTMNVGDTPELRVTLTPSTDGDNEYAFRGSYRSSNVSIRYGTFVSATKRDGDLVVRLKVRGIEGDFAPPEDAYWRDNSRGTARWDEPESGGSGRYEVELRRGSSKIHTVETTSRTYNFYPYMTKAGTYTFRVRTIPKTSRQEDYGKNSEWVDSDEIYIAAEDVSDGSGQSNSNSSSTSISGPSTSSSPTGNTRVGWQRYDNGWYYYYPDGSYKTNGWDRVNGKWYLFQNNGRMLSGWQNLNNQTYYLGDENDGAMKTGWVSWGQRWYYMNTTPDAYEGCMLKDRWLTLNGRTYYFDNTGAMVEGWKDIGTNTYYFYPGAGNMAVNTTIDGFRVNERGEWIR